jgi:hypothetical protein
VASGGQAEGRRERPRHVAALDRALGAPVELQGREEPARPQHLAKLRQGKLRVVRAPNDADTARGRPVARDRELEAVGASELQVSRLRRRAEAQRRDVGGFGREGSLRREQGPPGVVGGGDIQGALALEERSTKGLAADR